MPSFHLLRTVFWLIPAIAVYTVILGTLSLGSTVLGGQGHFAHWCARTWSWLILVTTGVRVEVRGLERLTPGATYVFVANHQSIYDIPVLFGSLPFQLRIIAKESLGRFPFLGWHLVGPATCWSIAGAQSAPGSSLGRARSRHVACRSSCSPRARAAATGMSPLQSRQFLPAVQAGFPIVPLSVAGSRHVMRKGRLTTRPGDVELTSTTPVVTVATPRSRTSASDAGARGTGP